MGCDAEHVVLAMENEALSIVLLMFRMMRSETITVSSASAREERRGKARAEMVEKRIFDCCVRVCSWNL